MLVYFAHALAWVFLLPPWQGPDEPGHYEYAHLLAQLRHPPHRHDAQQDVQARIIRSLDRWDFWRLTGQPRPTPLPTSFDQHPFLRRSGTQLGNETPLYYVIPALFTRLTGDPARACRFARLWSVLLGAWVVFLAYRSARYVWPNNTTLQHLFPLTVALLPMPTFIHATFNSNVLADVWGALFFTSAWGWLRRPRVSRREGAIYLILSLGALLIKRTTLLLLPLAPWPLYARTRAHIRGRPLLARIAILLLILPLLIPHIPTWAADWYKGRTHRPAARVPVHERGDDHALLLTSQGPHRPRAYVTQVLGPSALSELRGRTVVLQARVRALAQPTWACISVIDARGRSDACAWATSTWRTWSLIHPISPASPYVQVVFGLGNPHEWGAPGALLVDDAALRPLYGTRNYLKNGDIERPLNRFAYVLHRLQWHTSPRAGIREHLVHWLLAAAVLFTSFWGNFGWLQYPLPIPVYVLLALLSAWSVGQWWRWWRRLPPGPERDVWTFTGLAGVWFLSAMLLAAWRVDWLPQGRYMFPALLPLVALGLQGLYTAWPERYRARFPHVVLTALLSMAIGALLLYGMAL
ncbi:MAG: DUF2142 domain-containing protein [Chloroflexi bacterium]|nr:DUF2142 domain-containing protein [Chloroflexota bacterium]